MVSLSTTPEFLFPDVAASLTSNICQAKRRRTDGISKGCLSHQSRAAKLVRVERLELPRLAAPEPKSGVSTNFTIPASKSACCVCAWPLRSARLYITRFPPRKGKMTPVPGQTMQAFPAFPALAPGLAQSVMTISRAVPDKAERHPASARESVAGRFRRHARRRRPDRCCVHPRSGAPRLPAHSSSRCRR